MSWAKIIPTPEPEVGTLGPIQSWDPICDDIIAIAASWANLGHPITDSFKHLWDVVQATRRGERMFKLYKEVRNLLPDLPVMAHRYGDSPGAPGRLEVFFDNDADDYRSVCFADPYDRVSYINDNGKRIVGQVWYSSPNGDVDIIELDHLEPERVAAAVRYMYLKWSAEYVNGDAPEGATVVAFR